MCGCSRQTTSGIKGRSLDVTVVDYWYLHLTLKVKCAVFTNVPVNILHRRIILILNKKHLPYPQSSWGMKRCSKSPGWVNKSVIKIQIKTFHALHNLKPRVNICSLLSIKMSWYCISISDENRHTWATISIYPIHPYPTPTTGKY